MPGYSLSVQSCSYRRASCPAAPEPPQPIPPHGCALRGSREEDKEPGPGAHPQPSPSPVSPPGRAGCSVWEAPRPLRPRRAAVGQPVPRLPEGRRGGGGFLPLPGAGGDLTVTSHSSSSSCPTGFGAGGCPSFFLHVMEKNAVPHTHHTPRAHKSAPSSRAERRPGTAATRSGECATGGHVPGQRGERFHQDKPELGGAAAAEPAAPALLPAASLEAQIWVFGRGGGVWEEKEEGRHSVTPRQRSEAALRGERRALGRAGPGRARCWRRPEEEEDGRCHRWCCGRAPVRRCCLS